MERRLRQGDPLSPFLFNLAAEALHVMMLEANEKQLYNGACIGDDLVEQTHLQFADDVLFLGEWFLMNAMHLLKCLNWFEAASGLKINLNKSRLFGVGVSWSEVSRFAASLHCSAGKIPFLYLGMQVRANKTYTELG